MYIGSLLLAMVGVALGLFLAGQGLARASLWSGVVTLPLAAIGTVAAIWANVLTTRAPRESDAVEVDTEVSRSGREGSTVTSSGEVVQHDIRGTAVAHTGAGDVYVTSCSAQTPAGSAADLPSADGT